MRKLLLLFLIASLIGLFIRVGGPSAFQLAGGPPEIGVRAPAGMRPMTPPDPKLWKAYQSRNPGARRVICQLAYQERIPLKLAHRLHERFLWMASKPVASRLRDDYAGQGIQMSEDVTQGRIGGEPALIYGYTREPREERELAISGRGGFVIHEGYGIQMSCYGPQGDRDDTRAAFRGLAGSIRFPES